MNLTFDQAIEEHRKMWRWIAEQGEREEFRLSLHKDLSRFRFKTWEIKTEYLRVHGFNVLDIASCCFCCEYDKAFDSLCYHCPILWIDGTDHVDCMCVRSLYGRIESEDLTTDEFKRLCLEIAELPVNEEAREKI